MSFTNTHTYRKCREKSFPTIPSLCPLRTKYYSVGSLNNLYCGLDILVPGAILAHVEHVSWHSIYIYHDHSPVSGVHSVSVAAGQRAGSGGVPPVHAGQPPSQRFVMMVLLKHVTGQSPDVPAGP